MKLIDVASSRDNNFNLIRIIAAYTVLASHSFALAKSTGFRLPFNDWTGMTLSGIAVDVFFVISGFLITSSLLTKKNIIEFMWARILRIYPALFAITIITVFGIGLIYTTRHKLDYLSDFSIYKYLFKTTTLLSGITFELPGVFENNNYKNSVNGSLWTLPCELRLYISIALIWLLEKKIHISRYITFKNTVFVITITTLILTIFSHFDMVKTSKYIKLFFLFFSGSFFYTFRDKINLSLKFFIPASATLIICLQNQDAFFVIYLLSLAYITLYVAYAPSGFLKKYNSLGDYSYGTYIYAFPIQQTIAASFPTISPLGMTAASTFFTLIFATLSWHYLELPFLQRKNHLTERTQRVLSNISLLKNKRSL